MLSVAFAALKRSQFFTALCIAGAVALSTSQAGAQVNTYAGDAQHTGQYTPTAKSLNSIHLSAANDLHTGVVTHYGSPLVEANNTLLVPVKTATDGFRIDTYQSGAFVSSRTTDYTLPAHVSIPSFQPVLTVGNTGFSRLYYAGAGGTILYVDNPENPGSTTSPVREVFYTTLANYTSNASAYNSSIFINTPITADSNGTIFFGFRVSGTPPSPFNSAQDGFARIDVNGNATYVLAGDASGDAGISRDSHNSAPALSNDESTLYVLVKGTSTEYYGYLLGLNSTTLATKYKVFLHDSRFVNNATVILDLSAATGGSLGIENPSNSNTATIAFNPSDSSAVTASHIQTALTASNIYGSGNVIVGAGSSAGLYQLLFSGSLSNKPVALPVLNTSALTGTATIAYGMQAGHAISGGTNDSGILDDSSCSPVVGPDGDVYVGTFGNPDNGSRGFLLHFVADLSAGRLAGAFGYDYTPAIVPATMVPSYTGSSSYLLFCNYNNYKTGDGDGINTAAILDPNASQIDGHTSGNSLQEMREVLKVIGPTPDAANSGGVLPWAINAPAVNAATNSIFFENADGHIYRWNTSSNALTEALALTAGTGTPDVPTSIGPDGTIYTLNGGNTFAIGNYASDVSFSLASSAPDMRAVVAGTSLTFTATVHTGTVGGTPVGTFDFQDVTYNGTTLVTSSLATKVAVDSNGRASVTTSTLSADGTSHLGNHFITATYTGTPGSGSVTMVQKVHAFSTATALTSSSNPAIAGNEVDLQATVSSTTGTPTGYVTLKDGTNVISQVSVDSSGVASFALKSLSVGTHSLTAIYNSDTNYAMSSGSLSQTVSDNTTTTVTCSPNPSSYGQQVTLTAQVAANPAGYGTPSGTVTFTSGATTIGSSATALVNNVATASVNTSSLPLGANSITATFVGDTNWNGSTGSATATVVEGTTTTVSGSPNPSTAAQSVTFTATISPVDSSVGAPTGSVTFKEGTSTLGSGTVNGSGQATFSTSSLALGNHTITAVFTGTNSFGNSSASTSQAVRDTTTTTLGSTPNPSRSGQSVTITATVAGVHGGIPTGSVAFSDGSNALGTVTVDSAGHAVLTTSSLLTVASHTINAQFTATGFWGDSSGTLSQNVTSDTFVNLSASPSPSSVGQSVTFTASVSSNDTFAGVPTGSVVFTDGATNLGTATVDGTGHASISTSALTSGSHNIQAAFTGTGGWGSSGGFVTQFVGVGTTTAVGSSLNPSVTGESVTFTATVTAGTGTATGSIAFSDGVTALGTVTLNGAAQATFSSSALSVGYHNIRAVFTGTNGYENSTGSVTQQVVNDTTPPSVPSGVRAVAGPARGQIHISWNASSDPDDAVNHYEVWSSTKSTGTFTMIASPAGTSYTDAPGHAAARYYFVVAVDSHGNKSAASVKVTAKGF